MQNLPSNTRLVLTVILLPEESNSFLAQRQLPRRSGYIYGSVVMPLFDQNRRLKQSHQRLLLWPLEKFHPRFVCVTECYRYKHISEIERNFDTKMNVVISMPIYHTDVFWNLGKDIALGSSFNVSQKDKKDGKTDIESNVVEEETKQINQISELIRKFPLEKEQEEYDRKLVQQYRHFMLNISMFIRSINFTNQDEVAMCYNFLETSDQAKNCKPEDALALLDAEFGDERVRLFAISKLSMLNDTYLFLYVPQLVQALKYEIHHKSPLSEFLLERSLENPRLVGHAFFWALRAGLYEIRSYERFYLVLERFLMCCGKYKEELFRQNMVNTSLIKVHKQTMSKKKELEEAHAKDIKSELVHELVKFLKQQEFMIKLRQSLILDFSQKGIISDGRSFGYKNYVGNEFEIQIIEKVMNEYEEKYQNADLDSKKLGLGVHMDGRDEPIEWQKESIVFPFLPKKHVKMFSLKQNIFFSKQVPLLVNAVVKNQDDDDD